MQATQLLEMRGITKAFPGVVALKDVNLSVRAGEIHAVVGENGAGKSTLMKVLSGVYPHGSFDGEIRFDGEPRQFRGIAESEHVGIIIIHQELALVPLLSIAENIFLGNEPSKRGVVDRHAAYVRTRVARTAGQGGPAGIARDRDRRPRRRQAAAGRDRQGPVEEGQAADPRRADREPQRNRQRGAAAAAAGAEGPRHRLHPHLAQAEREVERVADTITVLRGWQHGAAPWTAARSRPART